jgi:hypothetical protein
MVMKILPTYTRLYQEDIAMLDRALDAATRVSAIGSDLDWFFVCWQLGQRHELELEEVLGPTAFGLSDLFDTSSCYKFSAHIGFNLCSAQIWPIRSSETEEDRTAGANLKVSCMHTHEK